MALFRLITIPQVGALVREDVESGIDYLLLWTYLHYEAKLKHGTRLGDGCGLSCLLEKISAGPYKR